jgi:hypothetical protein
MGLREGCVGSAPIRPQRPARAPAGGCVDHAVLDDRSVSFLGLKDGKVPRLLGSVVAMPMAPLAIDAASSPVQSFASEVLASAYASRAADYL